MPCRLIRERRGFWVSTLGNSAQRRLYRHMKTNKQTGHMPALEDSNGTWCWTMGHADGLYLGHKYHEEMIDRTTGTDYHWYKVGYDAGVAEFCFAEGDE